MSDQAVRLKRSEKVYLAGMKANRRRLNEEARELNWLDKCIEALRREDYGALRKLNNYDR